MIKRYLIGLIALLCVSPLLAQQLKDTIASIKHPSVGGHIVVSHVSGLTYSIEAVAENDYEFISWIDGVTTNPRQHTHEKDIQKDILYRAVFAKKDDIHLDNGDVSVSIADQNEPAYTLLATPKSGYQFQIWNDGTTTNSIHYEETDGTRYPFFVSPTGDISVSKSACVGGEVIVTKTGTSTYSLLAEPVSDEYAFMSWIDGNTANPRSFTYDMDKKEDVLVRAVFTKKADIIRDGGHVDVFITNQETPSYTLTAVADDDAQFRVWSNAANTQSVSYTETGESLFPYFVRESGSLSIAYHHCIGGKIEATQEMGMTYSIRAIPEDGYQFISWIDGNKTNPRQHIHEADKTKDSIFRAVFAKTQDIIVTGGSVEVTIANPETPEYTLTANAAEGCAVFYIWTNGSDSPAQSYREQDGTLFPVFNHGNKALKEYVTSCDGGTIEVQPLPCGFTIIAKPSTGYCFVGWDDNVTSAARDVDYSPHLYTANFSSARAKVNGVSYPTIQSAIDNAGSNVVEVITNSDEDITVSSVVTLNGQGYSIGNLTIANGGDLTLSGALTVQNLYLNTTTSISSQLRNVNQLTYTDAYVDITFEADQDKASPDKWYAFAVPFEVDVLTGVARQSGVGSPLNNLFDYLIWEYDGAMRASNKTNGWKQMNSGTLTPGQFYMIGIDGYENTWRFHKKSGAALGGEANMPMHAFVSDCYNQGWNAMGNSTLTYANASTSAGITIAQVYANGATTARYDVVNLGEATFVMASPFFIQTKGDDILSFVSTDAANSNPLHAPNHKANRSSDYFKLQLLQNGKQEDVVFLTASEDAIDEYEVGKDVIKMIGGNTNSYLYTRAYGKQLCAEDALLKYGQAHYELGIYAPKAGMYELNLAKSADAEVYLTCDYFVVWNLSQSPYTLELNKGTTNEYGLLIMQKSNAPTDNPQTTKELETAEKIIYHGQLYIRANGHIYNVFGNSVK